MEPSPTRAAPDPALEYRRRLNIARLGAEKYRRRDATIANSRLAVFIVGIASLFVSWWYVGLGVAVIAFVALVIIHERVRVAIARADALVMHYEDGLARLEGKWRGRGRPGDQYAPRDHNYALDLDLFGEGGLFELLCTVRTTGGERMLADWLCNPAPRLTVNARQEAISELKDRLDLREDLALHGIKLRQAIDPALLSDWASAPIVLNSHGPAIVAWTFSVIAAGVTALAIIYGLWSTIALVLAAELIFLAFIRARLSQVAAALEEPDRELNALSGVLKRLELEQFHCPLLVQLQRKLARGDTAASARIRQLNRLIALHDAQRNQMFAPFAIFFMTNVHVAYALERWRRRNGQLVATWVDAVGELEALNALAAFAFEHPDYTTPELIEDGPVYQGTALAHPLLHNCVPNDIDLGQRLRLLVVSGSNMSGKSTLLRTIGINAVLAQMGAPVRAGRLVMSPLELGATLRVHDSIGEGASRFYAELQRIEAMFQIAGARPLLFLLDEIMHGTNSHDRRAGASALVDALLARGALGLVTTHDLALAEIGNAHGPAAANVHFTDSFENGRLIFDYHLRPGVVEHGNALALMRSLGLPV